MEERTMAEKRYYYKKDGKPVYNLKEPLENILNNTSGYVEITEEEFNSLLPQPTQPTAAELEKQEKLDEIALLKRELAETDYVVIKIAESDDADEQASLRETYADIIAARKTKRARVDQLLSEVN